MNEQTKKAAHTSPVLGPTDVKVTTSSMNVSFEMTKESPNCFAPLVLVEVLMSLENQLAFGPGDHRDKGC